MNWNSVPHWECYVFRNFLDLSIYCHPGIERVPLMTRIHLNIRGFQTWNPFLGMFVAWASKSWRFMGCIFFSKASVCRIKAWVFSSSVHPMNANKLIMSQKRSVFRKSRVCDAETPHNNIDTLLFLTADFWNIRTNCTTRPYHWYVGNPVSVLDICIPLILSHSFKVIWWYEADIAVKSYTWLWKWLQIWLMILQVR